MALVVSENPGKERHIVFPKVFFMDRYEVSNQEYREFIQESGYKPANPEAFLNHWEKGTSGIFKPRKGEEDFPIVFVNYNDARAYAKHNGKEIPTKREWLIAALGTAERGKPFPWSNPRFMAFFCNSLRAQIGRPARVGTFENGKSVWGCYDMVGNVAEWTATPVKETVEPSSYIMGGSWSDGGTPFWEDRTFNLSLPPPSVELDSRNNTLGFRCIRKDALSFIQNTISSRISLLDGEERPEAIDELSGIWEELYSVLKLIQFDSLVDRVITKKGSPAWVRLHYPPNRKGDPSLMLCYSAGNLGLYTLRGESIWSRKGSLKDAPYGFMEIKGPGDLPRIIMLSVLKNNLLSIWDGEEGRELWRIKGREPMQHLFSMADPNRDRVHLLINGYIEDRYDNPLFRAPFLMEFTPQIDDIYQRIYFYAQSLLTEESYASGLWKRWLSFFNQNPLEEKIHKNRLFQVTNLGPAELYFGEGIRDRFRIQLKDGSFSNLEDRLAPGSILTLYDLETGNKSWSLDFPGALFEYQGIIKKEPLLLDEGALIALVLEERLPSSESPHPRGTKLCIIRADDGSIIKNLDLKLESDRLSELAVHTSSPKRIVGILDEKDVAVFEWTREGPLTMNKLSLFQIIDSAKEIKAINNGESPHTIEDLSLSCKWYTSQRKTLRSGSLRPFSDPPHLHGLMASSSPHSPWLLTKPDQEENCLLFAGFTGRGFEKAYLLKGIYNRYAHLPEASTTDGVDYFLLWGNSGDLLCLDRNKGDFLWKKNIGNIGELQPMVSDLDHDGSFEVMISSPSGEIRILDLTSGQIKMYLKKAGATLTCLLPVDLDQDPTQKILVGIKDEGIFLLDPLKPASSVIHENCLLTIRELERWRSQERAP